jgi:hypothetical protein
MTSFCLKSCYKKGPSIIPGEIYIKSSTIFIKIPGTGVFFRKSHFWLGEERNLKALGKNAVNWVLFSRQPFVSSFLQAKRLLTEGRKSARLPERS